MTSSAFEDALRAKIRQVLEGTTLAGVAFSELSMTRKESEPLAPDLQFPVEVEMGHQPTNEGMAYRIALSVERPDIKVSVSVVIVYHAKEPSALQAPDVAQPFGQLVALPAAYPYARAKLQEITIDTGVQPVFLGIFDMTKITATPVENHSFADDETGTTESA